MIPFLQEPFDKDEQVQPDADRGDPEAAGGGREGGGGLPPGSAAGE